MADRVLLGLRELGHRALRRLVVRQERGVVAEAAVAARRGCETSRAGRLDDVLDAGDGGRRGRARRRSAGGCPAGTSRRSLSRFSWSERVRARRSAPSARQARHRAPAPRCRSRRRSWDGRARLPSYAPCRGRCRRMCRRARGRAATRRGGRRARCGAMERLRSSRSLWGLALARTSRTAGSGHRGDDGPTLGDVQLARCPCRRARAARPGGCGRGACARRSTWTSTRPPSSVTTTLASTSATGVLAVVEVEQLHAVDDATRDGGDRAGQRRALDLAVGGCIRSQAIASATHEPVIEAQRVPPSAWSTSQSR